MEIRPSTMDEAVAAVKELAAGGTPVRPVGAGSRATWGGRDPDGAVALHTGALDRIVEHNPGDFTAVLQAGVPLAAAQEHFARAGQMLAVDPPTFPGPMPSGPERAGGTIGGLLATADSGPARHRFGGMRDLVIGVEVLLSDGTVARAGGKVIKNVAGYDLSKLYTGSYGTLGLVTEVAVRLHPLPGPTATVLGSSDDPHVLAGAALALAKQPLEALCLDIGWPAEGPGRLLLRFAGRTAADRARRIGLAGLDDVHVEEDDEGLWNAQRAAQRDPDGPVLKVPHKPADLGDVLATARSHGLAAVSRAALGLTWVRGGSREIFPRATVLDGAAGVADPWPPADAGALALMRRVKARMDPARIFRPGTFVGGI
ncbi:glycolate oxidase [Virgisporangium aliadipatigenens]|uniref:Glycolate oxidase n=1 Tax=Virgisporangium aliadipatigenens TaxID=741659 RepID=A0A8J3YJ77_9ACTN|nr:FAD-binding oxidoreductase [Virgisporangium aliadipatigenens]GIJ45020.1 glycolate oxidase [Virgisporangium aliadipatigenens]